MGGDKKDKKKDKKDKKDKKEKKDKKKATSEVGSDDDEGERTLKGDYETRLFVSPIAKPLAKDTLTKGVLKLIRKGMKTKMIKRGVKETVKAVRKGGEGAGVVIIAADISPIDVLSHLPILCEDKSIPYVFVRSRAEIGEACKTKRPTSCVLITKPDKKKQEEEYAEYKKCLDEIKAVNPYF